MELDSNVDSDLMAFHIGRGIMSIPYIIARSIGEARRHYRDIRHDRVMVFNEDNLKENNYSGEDDA
ncbi:hypothetical protein HY449_04715 [Candidatus Pacearchaeota archaeon]|nr:hypothetical protein [Candidatus Pacearchaeota archaeon]